MDETKVTHESETIDSQETVENELPELSFSEDKSESSQETVPLSVFLAQKEDLKELKREIKELASSKSKITIEGIEDLSSKYPDVSTDFINDMLSAATSKAKAEAMREVESKYSPIIEKQKQREELENFNNAFEKVFNKAIQDNPDLPKNIDKELIKTLVMTPKYKNIKISEILTNIYGSTVQGKGSSENETVAASEDVSTVTSFEKITPDQKKAIMDDPKARQKYFDWLDKQVG